MKSSIRTLSLRARIRLALWRDEEDLGVRSDDTARQHVFVALAADYGKLGDLAITFAQTRFFDEQFPDAVVEQLPISRTLPAMKGCAA